MKKHLLHIMVALTALVLSSCTHQELCLHHAHTAAVTFNVDWPDQPPTGMTVMAYNQTTGRKYSHVTHDISRTVLHLHEGTYHSIVFNLSEAEYGAISFVGMDRYETAEARIRATKSTWYKTKGEEMTVGAAPEMISIDCQEDWEVTQEMIDRTEEMTMSQPKSGAQDDILNVRHAPGNITTTVKIIVHVKGIHNLRSSRASLSGLAEGFMLAAGKPTGSEATLLIEDWKKIIDKTDPTKGTVEATISCFGFPEGHIEAADANVLTMSMLLVDNKTVKDYSFRVGDKFEEVNDTRADVGAQMRLEVSIEETLPDVKPEGGSGSGFDAEVEGWGEEEDFEVGV